MSSDWSPLSPDLVLPWTLDQDQEKKFQRYMIVAGIFTIILFVLINVLPVYKIKAKLEPKEIIKTKVLLEEFEKPEPKPEPIPEPEPEPAEPVPAPEKPVEKTEPPKPPEPAKVETKAPEPVKQPEKKVVEKPKPKPKPAVEEKKPVVSKASVAKSQGLSAMRSQLSALRGSLNAGVMKKEAFKSTKGQEAITRRATLGEEEASKISGGDFKINSGVMQDAPTKLQAHDAKQVEKVVAVDFESESEKASSPSTYAAGARDTESVRFVFERNKGPVFALYSRWLSRYPELSGVYRFEAVIQPNGQISDVKIISSTLGHSRLDREILARIQAIRFKAEKGAIPTKVEYTYNFFPS